MIIRFRDLNEYFEYHKDDKKITQTVMAQVLEVSISTISKWKTGKGYASFEKANRLELLFDIAKESVLKKTRWGYKKEGIFKRIIKRRRK